MRTARAWTGRARGPLSHASVTQLAALRALVSAYLQWERRLGSDQQTLSPEVPTIGRVLALPTHIEAEIGKRVRRRIERRPDRDVIEAHETDLRRRARDPEFSQAERTAAALEGIHRELTRIREHLEAEGRA